MIALGRRFIRNQRGATAVEFSFVMVPFFALMFSIFENGFLLLCDDGVAHANYTASRQVLIGAIQNNNTITTATQYRDQLICNPVAPLYKVVPTYIDCSKIIVDAQAIPNGGLFTAQNQSADFYTSPGTNKFCLGNAGDIVMLRLFYPMPAYFPILTSAWLAMNGINSAGLTTINGQLVHVIVSATVFQAEPFGPGNTAKPGC